MNSKLKDWSTLNKTKFESRGDRNASGSDDGVARVWDDEINELIHRIDQKHTGNVTSAAISPDRKLFATGKDDGSFQLWHAVTGDCRATAMGCNGKVQSLVLKEFTSGLRLMTGGEDGSVRQWKFSDIGGGHKPTLDWSSSNEVLNVTGTSFADVTNLSHLDRELLKQRGASVQTV
ncbi:hypothetical protein BGX27_000715 [Mortierella sp. AM989]|nr:hypothetical protein BGX27_000715 [Mortierella sp. AM989]